MKNSKIMPDVMIFSTFVQFLISINGYAPNVISYNTLINVIVRFKGLIRPMYLLRKSIYMRSSSQPNSSFATYPGILLDYLCKNRHLDEAMALLKTIEGIIWILIYKFILLSLMEACLCPNVRTYTIMINGLCKRGLLREAYKLFMEMDENGLLTHMLRLQYNYPRTLQIKEAFRAIPYSSKKSC
ncbi:hypothetical protein PVL29_018323 [Vitis rotundifolia]|uniref:Pentatricopeptide repeat-containing protein n=1 Tax=Vitis rotundifolia TaxID=103349 RepID=A0AA38Z4S8_VITRO|nr:hypothetical protein PVL29_018323 [Vitis rotundifolia]